MGLLSFVHTPYVLYEMSFLRKVFTTVSTGERFLTLMDTLDVLIKIILAIKHFGTSLTCIARTSMAPPNMAVSPLNSSKTFPTQHTHEPYPLHHLGRLYLYFNFLLHCQGGVYIWKYVFCSLRQQGCALLIFFTRGRC